MNLYTFFSVLQRNRGACLVSARIEFSSNQPRGKHALFEKGEHFVEGHVAVERAII
jgi:hypothetical protein